MTAMSVVIWQKSSSQKRAIGSMWKDAEKILGKKDTLELVFCGKVHYDEVQCTRLRINVRRLLFGRKMLKMTTKQKMTMEYNMKMTSKQTGFVFVFVFVFEFVFVFDLAEKC